MPSSSRTLATAALLAIAVAALYATRLGFSPVYLMHDESKFALQAQSIASSGRDMTGHFLPIYFTEAEFPAGRDPIIIYATALTLKVLPLSEATARLATALAGVVDVVLMFFLSRRLFGSDRMGVAGAAMLALTPGHFMRSRLVLSPVFALPFILAWLLWLARFGAGGRQRDLAGAMAWLAIGMYSYLACMVMMPLYVGLTLLVIAGRRASAALGPAALGFAVPLVPMGLWYVTHPERYSQIVAAYRLFSAGQKTAATPSLGLLQTLKLRLDLLWSFFSPDFLFVSGHSSLIDSTRQAGVFAMALAVLIPVGAYALVRGRGGVIGRVIVAGFFTAPLATVLSGHVEMNRVLFVIPFGVLTALYGVDRMMRAGRWKWVAAALLIAIPIQFASFYRDYMGQYRVSAAGYFGGNLRDALADVIARQPVDPRPVYLSRHIPFADRYWRFYAIAHGRADLVERAIYFDSQTLEADSIPHGAALVCGGPAPCDVPERAPADWQRVSTATEPDGTASFTVFEKR